MIDKDLAERISAFVLDRILHVGSGVYPSEGDGERDALLRGAATILWEQLMLSVNAYDRGRPPLVSEKALACIIRRGADRRHLRMEFPRSRLTLPHFNYFLEKQGAGCIAGPCTGKKMQGPITLQGEEFADFLFEFDSIAAALPGKIDRALAKRRIESIQHEILCQTIEELGEEYLAPYGITARSSGAFSETDIYISLSRDGAPSIAIIVPIASLAEVFRQIPTMLPGEFAG